METKFNLFCWTAHPTSDGTQCFMLNQSVNGLVQSVEMVGGKVRWQVDRQQMGRLFSEGISAPERIPTKNRM